MKLLTNGILKIDGSLDVEMLRTPEECEEILSILSIRQLVAKIADGDIESSELEQASAVIKCSNIDYMFGLLKSGQRNKELISLEEKIYLKQIRLAKEKKERIEAFNKLINSLKDWDK